MAEKKKPVRSSTSGASIKRSSSVIPSIQISQLTVDTVDSDESLLGDETDEEMESSESDSDETLSSSSESTLKSSSVTTIESKEIVSPYSPGVKYQTRCIYKFRPELWDELCLEIGDICNILEPRDSEEKQGWLYGVKVGTTDRGYFPKNHVEKIKIVEDPEKCEDRVEPEKEVEDKSMLFTPTNREFMKTFKQREPGSCRE